MNNDIKRDPEQHSESSSLATTVSHDVTPVNDYDIDAFLEKRKEFIEKVNAIMVEKQDYHVIQGKKSLGKGGAEKIASIFGWVARFEKDTDVMESFSGFDGLVAFTCDLTKGSMVVGQGRGAAILGKNGSDPNKTVKMAQKSAFIDAVLRASGLSDFFTQDLEDMNMEPTRTTQPTPTKPIGNPAKGYNGYVAKGYNGYVAKGYNGYVQEGYNGNPSSVSQPATETIGEGAQMLISDYEKASTAQEYKQISDAVTISFNNGKLNNTEYHAIVQAAKATVKRLEQAKKNKEIADTETPGKAKLREVAERLKK